MHVDHFGNKAVAGAESWLKLFSDAHFGVHLFQEFEDNRDADDAVYKLNGKELLGERVAVEPARGQARGGHRDRERYDDRYGGRRGGRYNDK